MVQYALFTAFVILTIAAVNVWHIFAGWFVRSQGYVSALLLLAVIVLLAQILDPYWED